MIGDFEILLRNMSKYRLIIFDLDGTLLDTSPGIINAANRTLVSMGFNKVDPSILSKCIGPPLASSMSDMGLIPKDLCQEFSSKFRRIYESEYLLDVRTYNGMEEILSELHSDYQLGVATNKPQKFTDTLLSSLNLKHYFDVVHGADLSGTLKKPDLIKLCMSDLSIIPEKTLMVGDTVHDLEGAIVASVDFIGVSFGFGFKAGEPNTINEPRDLINWIRHIESVQSR